METATIARAVAGDRDAFRALYDRHHRRVYALALRLMTDRSEAEELTQDVFVAAWKRLADFRAEGRFVTWLQAIAVRLARQRWRGLFRRRRRLERWRQESFDEVVRAAMPTTTLSLEHAIACLPERMRTALVLHAVEGYSQAETAEVMGVAVGTVKAQVHRARELVRRRLEGSS